MYKRYAITLPEELVKKVEKERKETGLNRSEFFRKAVTSFIGSDSKSEEKLDKKYGPIYKSLDDYNIETSDEMMEIASKTIPER